MMVQFNNKLYSVIQTQDEFDSHDYIDSLDVDNRLIQMYNTGTGMINEIQNYDMTTLVFIPSLGHKLLVAEEITAEGRKLIVMTHNQFDQLVTPVPEESKPEVTFNYYEYGDYIRDYMNPYHLTTEDVMALSELIQDCWTKAKNKVKQLRNKNNHRGF